jgi:hypothetical protein
LVPAIAVDFRFQVEALERKMADARFDILFAGEVLANASPYDAQRRLQQSFKLSDAATARLFDGRTHTIKRNLDTAAATRYREIFRDAGALIEIRPIKASSGLLPSSSDEAYPASGGIEPVEQTQSTESNPPPREAPWGSEPAERPPADDLPQIDYSYLSLVEGRDWTLEDCQPSLPPTKLPDTSHLKLVEPAPDDSEENKD